MNNSQSKISGKTADEPWIKRSYNEAKNDSNNNRLNS